MSQGKKRIQPEDRLDVGKIKAPHGLKGEVYVLIFSGEWEWLDHHKKLDFHQTDDSGHVTRHQFKVKRYRPYKKGFIAKFEGVNDRNHSEALQGAILEIPGELLVAAEGETPYLNEFLEFQVHLEGEGVIGRVIDFSSNGSQDLLVVETAKGTFEVPFVDAFTKEVDREEKTIYLDLPEGLIEL